MDIISPPSPHTKLQGSSPASQRRVTPVPKDLLGLVPVPKNVTIEIKSYGTDPERDTVPLIKKKIRKSVYQVERLARKLKKPSVYATVQSDWNFIFDHIEYKEDPENIEAVRDPNRTIYDGKGDCDCFTVCLGAMLQAQRIPFKIRVAAYENKGEWNHVYIVVPNGKDEIILDPVMDTFNTESAYIDKKDFDMKLVSLEGPMNTAAKEQCDSDRDQSRHLRRYMDTQEVLLLGYIPTQQFLEDNSIPYYQETNESTQSSDFVINTPGGQMKIPTIITQDQAQRIKQIMASAADQARAAAFELSKDIKWWWLVAGAVALWLVFSGGASNQKKEKPEINGAALAGPKKKRKKKRSERLAVVNI